MKLTFILAVIAGFSLLMSSCGGGEGSMASNDYLGKLPSISENYQSDIDEFKEKAKRSTDMEDAFEYDKKYKLTKEEADIKITEYVKNNLMDTPIPFVALEDSKYEVMDLFIKGASRTRLNLESNVKIKEDLKNKYGGFEKYFFAYIKAVDIDGNMVGKPTVMSSNMGSNKSYTAGLEVPIKGSIGNHRFFGNFEKIIFITKDEYQANK